MKVREVINAVLIFIIVILMLFCIIFVISKYVFKNNIPSFFGYSFVRVENNDMHPTLEIGDLLLIKEEYEYKNNDIVVKIDNNGNPIIQRIVEIDDINVITKGDNLLYPDEALSVNSIRGKMTHKFSKIFRKITIWHVIVGVLIIAFIDALLNYLIYQNSKHELRRW